MRGGAEDQSADEVCDGFDNDCDGIVDQGLFMDSIDLCPTSGVCAQHPALLRSTCILGLWQCDPSLVPGYEAGTELSCDGLDNDCDGLVDEDFILLDYDGQQKIIEESCGTGACADGWVVCAPDGRGIACSTAHLRSEEGCDGLDNDCDGLTDEGQTYQGNALGSPCTGVGACGAGVVQCSPASRKATCSTNPDGMDSEAHPEACDGLDNNCNGLTDEGLTGVVPCSALGVCEDAVAVAQCLYGQWVCNYGFLPNWQADETSCDGLDNDCDGFVDERLAKSMLLATASHRTGSPPARSGSARIFARHGTDRWIVGGQVHPFPYLGVRPHVGDLWHFESLTGRWRTAEDIGLSGRRDAAGAELPGGDLVIVGGQSQSGVLADAWRVGPSAADIAVLWPPGTITGRYGHLVVPVQSGGTLLLVGGRGDGDIWLDSVLVPVDGSPGVSVPEIPWMVHSASCAMDDGDVVVLGGPGPGGSGGGLFHVDVELGAVEPLPGAGGPGPRLRCGLVCLSDRIIALGGVDEAGQALADVWAYDLATGQWGVLPSLPEPLSDVVAVDKGGVEVLWGIRADGTALASMVRWVSAADEGWIVEEQVPPLAAASGTVDMLRRQLCVLGGFVSGTTGPVPNHQYFCLDERGLLVEKGELPDSDPVLFSLATWDPYRDRMLVLGGSHFPPGGEPQFLSPVCRYLSLDRGSSSWSSFAPCNAGPGAVSAPAAAVRWKDMTWWIQGGVTPGGVSTSLWQFSFITGEWTVWQFPTSLPARYGHMMGFLEGEDHLILAGGAGAGSSVTVVDLQNLDWTTVATQPFVEHSFRPVFLEAQSRTLVWVGHSETFAAQLAAGQDSLPLQPLFSSAGTGLLATQWVSPWSRQGILFGGIDRFGLSVSHWTEITPGCLP
jgi:hypothetical protein